MKKKNYYMVQASAVYGDGSFKAAYLPYAAGLLVANANTYPSITESYCFKGFVFMRDDIDSVLASLVEPCLIGFSCYVWNTEYNKALAQAVKSKYPQCTIVFGGHNVPPDTTMLEENKYIDFLLHAEGEESFSLLLLELLKDAPDYSSIPGLSWFDGTSYNQTSARTLTRTDYPSPYLTGVFDDILRNYPDMQHDAILETSRGCPRSCAYCDWGCTASRVKLFDINRIKKEIDWFAENKIAFLWGADANFGSNVRDEEIADYIVSTRERTGYPERIRINYAKDANECVLHIIQKFSRFGVSKEGATLSFQSLSDEVLRNIGRKNMSLSTFSELMKLYKTEGITAYSELIIGLPGETYDSFCRGIGMLLEAGQHHLIHVYNCELLPNSPMASPEYIKKFGIITSDVVFVTAHSKKNNIITEKTRYIVGTDSMKNDEWIKANIFACFEKSFHHYGLLKSIAIYLHEEHNVLYEDFYRGILDWAISHPDSMINSAYLILYSFYESVCSGKNVTLYINPLYGDITWPPEHVPILEAIYNLERFYREITPYIVNLSQNDPLCSELIDYQKITLKHLSEPILTGSFNYNWTEYFSGVFSDAHIPLKKKKCFITARSNECFNSWHEYAKNCIWFGRNNMTFNTEILSD